MGVESYRGATHVVRLPRTSRKRYLIDTPGPLGLRLGSGFPVVIDSVHDASVAASLRIPVHGTLVGIDGHMLTAATASSIVPLLGRRPVEIMVEAPVLEEESIRQE